MITELRQELKCSLRFILEMIKENPELPQISRSDYYYVITKEDNGKIQFFEEHTGCVSE